MKPLRKEKSQAKVDTGKPIAALPKKSQKTSAASPGKPHGVSKPKAKKEEKVAKNDSSTVGKHSKRKSEIDDLFGQLKNVPRESKQANEGLKPENVAPKVQGNKNDIFGTATTDSRKRTDEGYTVYTEEELGLSKRGGDTPSCPFDCDCCF